MSNIDEFKKLYNFEFEKIKTGSFKEVSEKYLAAYKDGKEKGYTPVFLVLDDNLLETFEIKMEDEDTDNIMDIVKSNLEKYKDINAVEFLKKFQKENTEDSRESIDDYFTEKDYKYDDSEKYNLELSTLFDYDNYLKDDVILVKVPTEKPYEVLGYFGMGGYNECPFPAEQVAVAKYWYEKYGAVPVSTTYDEIEFYVERPPQTLEETKKLAIEHYAFCYGLLWECYDTLDELASAIYKNVHWYFWWS
ncbi:DUF4253 domain-containing protein [Fusobacterium pseudoperiodonticum]|uniref:DUF4253 domain-containing protein n=1 Tax=Fusobacterium pseudoperiodonticum TaxID=2663009 RepID=UPI000C1C15E7|nr:DUF4253 domain-containing protein [Fusobacterium pseudoperiodonticum]ATV64138.1 hypothetical protein CTM78_06830 [Fusobacterium pseudoperiodonticum]